MRNALRESPRRREKRRQRFSGGYGGPAGLGKQRSGPVGFGARLSRSGAIQWPCQRFESRRRVESARASPRTEGLRHVVEKKAQIRRRSPHRPARLCRFRRSADDAGFAEYPRRLAGSFADASDETDLPQSPIYFITYVSSLRRRCYAHLGSVGRERPDRPPQTSSRCGVPRGQTDKLWRSV